MRGTLSRTVRYSKMKTASRVDEWPGLVSTSEELTSTVCPLHAALLGHLAYSPHSLLS